MMLNKKLNEIITANSHVGNNSRCLLGCCKSSQKKKLFDFDILSTSLGKMDRINKSVSTHFIFFIVKLNSSMTAMISFVRSFFPLDINLY